MMNVKIKPLGNRLLVKRAQTEEKTKGGIYLPDTSKEKPREGVVVAAGAGKVDEEGRVEPMAIHVGDKILFNSYGGTPVKNSSGEEEFLILSEDEVLGILN